jgi:hypothetical protein
VTTPDAPPIATFVKKLLPSNFGFLLLAYCITFNTPDIEAPSPTPATISPTPPVQNTRAVPAAAIPIPLKMAHSQQWSSLSIDLAVFYICKS